MAEVGTQNIGPVDPRDPVPGGTTTLPNGVELDKSRLGGSLPGKLAGESWDDYWKRMGTGGGTTPIDDIWQKFMNNTGLNPTMTTGSPGAQGTFTGGWDRGTLPEIARQGMERMRDTSGSAAGILPPSSTTGAMPGNIFNPYFGSEANGYRGGTPLPPGMTYYGGGPGGLQYEAARQEQRGNEIGNAFGELGDRNQQMMSAAATSYGNIGGMYAGRGGADYDRLQMDRMAQIANANAAGYQGNQNFTNAGIYGRAAQGQGTALSNTQNLQLGIGGSAGNVSAGDRGTSNMLLGQAQQNQMMQGINNVNLSRQAQSLGGQSGGNFGTSNRMLGAAGQDYGLQQDARGQSQGAIDRLRNFYEQGPGPSAAEAQLKMSSDQSMASALSLARSGRGAGDNAAALRQAQFQNAATRQQTGQQLALLRAQEGAGWRGQQLQAMGAEQGALGNMRAQDLGAMGQNMGAAGQFAGLGYQGAGLQQQGLTTVGAQNLQQQGMNLGSAGQFAGLGYQGMGINAQQANTVAGQQLGQLQAYLGAQQGQGQLGYQGLGLQEQGLGRIAGQDIASMQANNQMGLGYGQLGLGYNQTGLQNRLGYAGLQNQQYLTSDQLRQQMMANQLQSDTSRYGIDRNVQIQQAQMGQQSDAAMMSFLAMLAAGGVAAASDIRGKENIKPENITAGDFLRKFGYGMMGKTPPPSEKKAKTKGGNMFDETPEEPAKPAPAPWEMGVSPFAAQAPPVPFGQDPRNPQAQTPIDFTQLPTGIVGSDERGKHVYSDERGKTDLRPAQGYSYDYKNPNAPGAKPGRQFGPMAQDLEKTPAGRSVVQTGPDGMKSIDTSRLSLVNTSAISEQQRRLDRLEELAGRRR